MHDSKIVTIVLHTKFFGIWIRQNVFYDSSFNQVSTAHLILTVQKCNSTRKKLNTVSADEGNIHGFYLDKNSLALFF